MSASPTPTLNFDALLDPPAQAASRRKGRMLGRRELCVAAWETDADDTTRTGFGFDERKHAQRWLHDWAHTQTTALAFMTGNHGEGKTDLLQALVERMARRRRRHPDAPVPFYVDLARLTHPRFGGAPGSLASALRAELARRELPHPTQALLQAVSDGHVVLILDHAEAIAPHHPSVWRWMGELPDASTGLPCRQARVLLCCRQEWFTDMTEAQGAAAGLQHALEGTHDTAYLLHIQPVAYQQERAWLAAAGIRLNDNHDLSTAWNCFGHQTRALGARIQALKPLFANAPGKPPTWQEVHSAWWRHCLLPDLGLDDAAMVVHATTVDLTQAREPLTVGELAAYQHAALIERQWPRATAAQRARIAMAMRVGLQLRGEHGRVRLTTCHRWLGQSGARAIEDSDLDTLMTALVNPPRRKAMTEAVAAAWFAAGHHHPPTQVAQWLCEPQNPHGAGALFELGCAMARHMALHQARTDRERLRTPSPPKSHAQYLSEALALAWPTPLSTARLRGAELRGANFRDVLIEGADLSEADLTDADFSQARLVRVTLNRTRANKACFNEAEFTDVEAHSFVARNSQWVGAQWNRLWPSADLRDASTSVSGVDPSTASTEFRMQPSRGAAKPPFRRLVGSPDGQWLAALGDSGTLGVWRAQDLAPVWHVPLPGGPIAEVLDLCFSHDSQQLITSHGDASLRSWSAGEGDLVAEHHRPQFCPVHQLLSLGDSGALMGLSLGGQTAMLDKQLNRLTAVPAAISWAMGGGTYGAAVHRTGHTSTFACVRSFRDGGVFEIVPLKPRRRLQWGPRDVWRMASTQGWLAVLETNALWIGDPDADTAQWHIHRPDAVVHGEAYRLLVQEARQRTGRPVGNNPPDPLLDERQSFDRQARVADIVFSPDGHWLVCVGGGPSEGIAVDTRSGAVRPLDAAASAGANSATFTADGRLILGGPHLVACPLPTNQDPDAPSSRRPPEREPNA